MRLDPAVAATRRAVRDVLGVLGDGPVLVACSGGPDSVALAAAVAFEAPRAGMRWTLVTIDHGLQPGSAEQAQRVERLGRTLVVGAGPASTLTLRVEVGHDGGPEGAARAARYAALRNAAVRMVAPTPPELSAPGIARTLLGADNSSGNGGRVLLGHTRDDQAETVLLGLGRGSGPRSIAGMQQVDGLWVRPFLGLDRSTTVAACEAQGLPTWQDPHNTDDRFVRVRLRHEVLPLLEDVLHGGVAASLARTADLLRDDLDALEVWANQAYQTARVAPSADQLVDPVDMRPDRGVDDVGERGGGTPGLVVGALEDLPRAVRTRVLRRWAGDCGAGPLTAGHTAALDALLVAWRGQGPVALPGGVTVRAASGTLCFVPAIPPSAPQE